MKVRSNLFFVMCAVTSVSLGGCEGLFDENVDNDGSHIERVGTSQCVQVDEGGTATLSCPSGQVIASIDFASYGTPTGSCPSFSSSSCHASSSKSKVEVGCLNKQSCTVGANNGVFGDPCGGTYKKLVVAYSCVNPNAAQCAEVNEGGTATLSCPSGQTIGSITFASYGTPTGSCPNFSNGSCHASSSKSTVEAGCLNKQSCTVGANNGVFGDPCVGTVKKLAVAYSCVSPNAAKCVQGNEGSTAALSCPSGQVIKSIAFASYGTPTGSCPNFVASSCHASSSKSKVEAACLNKQSCNVGANNGVFGDPCVGTSKKLAVVYSCGGSTDNCPDDPDKTQPGVCGCGVPEGTCSGTGTAATPPMGWNSWNRFGCNVSEDMIKGIADAMVSSGMKAAGYEYVNIDDCWQVSRDGDGTIVADPERFPSGMKALADYVHGKGLKLGVYSDRGVATCAGRPGSQGYEQQDAATYAAWGVDYLKYDNCFVSLDQQTQYQTMRDALDASGRAIVFSICAWSFASWMPEIGQLWRTTGDISDTWGSVVGIIDINANLAEYAGPGHWNDPDMLEVGNGGMSATEYRAHFSMWAIMAAPLIAGNDLRSMSNETRAILTASEIIQVDQDPLGNQGQRVRQDGVREVWAKIQSGSGVRAVALFNRGEAEANITVSWLDIWLNKGKATVRDLWARADLGSFVDGYTTAVPAHGVVMLKITGEETRPPSGTVYVSDLAWRSSSNGWGPVERDRSNGDQLAGDGHIISIVGQTYAKGLGVHAASEVRVALGGACSLFTAKIGIDDETADQGSVVFQIQGNGDNLFKSEVMRGTMPARPVSVDVTGKSEILLVVTDAEDGKNFDHADWADAKLICN